MLAECEKLIQRIEILSGAIEAAVGGGDWSAAKDSDHERRRLLQTLFNKHSDVIDQQQVARLVRLNQSAQQLQIKLSADRKTLQQEWREHQHGRKAAAAYAAHP